MTRKKRRRRTRSRTRSQPPLRPPLEEESRPPSSPRILIVLVLVLLAALTVAGLLLLYSHTRRSTKDATAAPEDRAEGSDASSLSVEESHARMLAALEEIRLETPERNPYLGDRTAREARERLSSLDADAPPRERFDALVEVADEELRLGNEGESIARYEEAYSLMSQVPGLAAADANEVIFRFALAHLRFGETQNCATHSSAESCILPIRGGGLHHDPRGSRRAIQYFLEVLDRTPGGHPLSLKAIWLLNLAYMTLGTHPREVPEQYLIPLEIYGSPARFPRFENIAPVLGLDTFDLFGGMVVDDFTGNGHLDVLTTTFDTAGQMRFFVNQGDGSFADRTADAGLEGLYGGLNALQADYDNDGDLDLLVLRGAWLAENGRHPNSLLRNERLASGSGEEGETRFVDVTFAVGLGEAHYPTQTAAWADYDNDGDLDLYIGNEQNREVPQAPCQLFRNEGADASGRVSFTDVARAAGVARGSFVKGVVWGDYDDDRFPDLYVSTLGGRNRLYRNDGAAGVASFTELAHELGVDIPIDSFPVWFWDFDNDGALDLWVSSYRGVTDAVSSVAASYVGLPPLVELPRLYRGDGRGGFEEVAGERGLTRLHMPMGANFGDLDNDGYEDFYLGTGYPDYESLMPNVLYHNQAGRRFVDVSLAAGVGHLQKGHAVAFGDFDADGDVDIFQQMGGAYPGDRFYDAVYENPGFGNGWISLELVGRESNRSAIGARIQVRITEGEASRTVYKRVTSGGSFGANPLRQTIGLGTASRVDRLEVYWPTSDRSELFAEVEAGRFYRLVEGRGELVELQQ